MKFKRKPIRKKLLTPPVVTFITAVLLFAIFIIGVGKIVKGLELRKVLFLFGKDLEEDAYGHTNLLLLGTGGDKHDAGDLTDTMIVANIDQDNKKVTLISIPRDFYVVDKKIGGMRINELYFTGKKNLKSSELGLELTKNKVEDILGIDIQYYMKIDFSAFVDVIDAIGGIDVNVPSTIFDPLYPKGETGYYETFFIGQGLKHLDGETALKYARSRHSTSDFSRSERQQQIIYAMKDKAQKSSLLSSPGKLEDIYDSFKEKMETNLGSREIIRLAEIAAGISQENIQNYLIHDDPSKCGGFLYTPERELYGGAFVFVPAGNSYDSTRKMTNIIFNNYATDQVKLQILNGTKKAMLAAKTKVILKRHCFDVTRFGNGESGDKTTTMYYQKKQTPEVNATISLLQQFVPGTVSTQIPEKYLNPPYASDADIIIELGSDYLRYEMKDPFDYIVTIEKPKQALVPTDTVLAPGNN